MRPATVLVSQTPDRGTRTHGWKGNQQVSDKGLVDLNEVRPAGIKWMTCWEKRGLLPKEAAEYS